MAVEYFLYTTLYNNTLVERSETSFAPLPPDTGEINIDYFIPSIQPLYLYRESGGTIVENDQDTINSYLAGTAPSPEPEDPVEQQQFTGYTATTDTKIDNKINKVTGAEGQVPVFISGGNLESSNYTISELLNQYANVLIVAKSGATYSTIGAAINASTSADVIFVKPGVYVEDLTISENINLVGSCGKKTKISGVTTFTNSSSAIIFKNVGFENTNDFAVRVDCGDDDGKISLVDCYVDTIWNSSDGQSITTAKSNIKISRGKLSISRGRYSIISSGDNASEHNTSIYWLDGSDQIDLDVFGAFQTITNTTDPSQNLELVYIRNSNSNTSYVFKNGNIKFFGVDDNDNYVAPFYSINADNLEGIVEGNLIEINDTGNAYTAFNYGSDTPIVFTNNSILPNNVSDLYAAWSDSGTINVVQNFFNVSTKPQISGNVNYSMTNNIGSLYLSSELFAGEKINLDSYSNSTESEGDFWWNGTELNFRTDTTTINLLSGGTGGGGTWGSITGTLSDQTDLQSALDNKTNNSTFINYTGITAPNTFLTLSGGSMDGDVLFDVDDGLGGKKSIGLIGVDDLGQLRLSGTSAISLDAPAIQIKNASGTGYTGALLSIGNDGYITYTFIENNDKTWTDNIGSSTITNTSENVIATINVDEDFTRGEFEWSVTGNLPWWRTVTLRAKRNGVTKYTESYENTGNFEFSYSGAISETVTSGDTFTLTIQSDVANYDISGEFLEIVKYELSTVSEWGSITGDISNQIDLQNALNAKVNRTGDTITGDLRVEQSLYVTGTSATTLELQGAVLLGALTSDGKIVATTTPALNVSEAVTDVSVDTTITEISGIYYVDTTAGDVTLTIPNAASDNDAKKMSILKKAGTNNVVIVTVGGTQNIGNQTTQTISQTDKGLSIVADNDNSKWIVVQDSRYVEGQTEGELQFWNNTLKVWQPTSNDITWENTDKKFTVGGNSDPQTFQVDATDDIVYINASGLTGLATADNLGFYAGGRGAFGNSVTIDRLRADAPSNEPRSLSLIDDNAVMRVWRFVDDTGDPAVEFIWGTGATPSTIGNAWWDMFLDGAGDDTDSFAIRRRTGGGSEKLLTVSTGGTDALHRLGVGEKLNLSDGFTNSNTETGDMWYNGDESLFFTSSGKTYDLLGTPTGLTAVQVRRTTDYNISTSFGNVTFDITDTENNPEVLEHNNTNTERIDIKQDGLYLILFDGQINNGGSGSDEVALEIVKNAGATLLEGGDSVISVYSGDIQQLQKQIVVSLSDGDYIYVRLEGESTGLVLDPTSTFSVVLLEGIKGATGAQGAQGLPGSGVKIVVTDDGVNPSPTGGSYSTINFEDNLVATDAGDGETVNITYSASTVDATAGKIQLVDSIGGQDINPIAATALTWGQEDFKDSATFTHAASGSTITVLKTGLYELSFNVNGESGNGRSEPGIQFRNNSSVIAPTLTADYGRNTSNNDTNNALPPYLISLTANDVLDVVAFRLGDATANTSKTGASFMRITYLG